MNGSDGKKPAAIKINNKNKQSGPDSPGQGPPSATSNGNKKRRKGANDLKPIITADRKSHEGSPASSTNSMNHSYVCRNSVASR
jgi:hypothetical protein